MMHFAILAAMSLDSAAAMFSNSVVQVDYTLTKASADRSREVSLRTWCPVCNSTHKRTAADSERGIPATMPGFVLSPTQVVAQDPGVRAANLGGIAIRIGGERIAAREVARVLRPRAVVLETEKPIAGVRPLEFSGGAISNWFYLAEHEGLRCAGFRKYSDDEGQRFYPDLGLTMLKAPFGCIGISDDGKPVTVSLMRDFDAAECAANPPSCWKRIGADVFEKAASARESAILSAALPVVVSLEPPKRDSQHMGFHIYYDPGDDSKKKDFDSVGFAMEGGLVLMPSTLTGEQIGRISKIEAKMPDGKSVRLSFDGAYAEWNALALRFEGGDPEGLVRLSLSPGEMKDPFGSTAWSVIVENENGRVKADSRRGVLNGTRVVRDGALVPSFAADCAVTEHSEKSSIDLLVTDEGRVLTMKLARRYGPSHWRSEGESVSSALLTRLLTERPYNPEFTPRVEDDRNRLVWLGVETVALTAALAREKNAQSETEDYRRPPLVTEVYPGSPADKAGIRADDILLAVRREGMADQPLRADSSRGTFDAKWFFSSYGGGEPPWPNVENSVNKLLTQHGVGAKLTLVYSRGGERREADIVLEAAPVHFKNAKRARNRTLGLSVADLTFEVRRFFKFDDNAPGVVIAKVKPGSPAQVAGLHPCELVTEVNGSPVKGASDFAAKVKDASDLTFSVRRLAETRVVRIRVNRDARRNADGK